MNRTDHIRLLAQYNQQMNARLISAAETLSEEALKADRQAFFGSIFGTLNHLAVADTLWLKRFALHPATYVALSEITKAPTPTSLGQQLHPDLNSLTTYRRDVDQMVIAWTEEITEPDLDHVFRYTNSRGDVGNKPFFGLVMHFFNHQTHHRGQATALLSQAGADYGVTDLITLMRDEPT
ncbi:MAG: DinB family protein [Burkholderiaceae bacterium]